MKLEHSDVKKTAGKLKFRTKAFIDGKFVNASAGKTYVSLNPATGLPEFDDVPIETVVSTAPAIAQTPIYVPPVQVPQANPPQAAPQAVPTSNGVSETVEVDAPAQPAPAYTPPPNFTQATAPQITLPARAPETVTATGQTAPETVTVTGQQPGNIGPIGGGAVTIAPGGEDNSSTNSKVKGWLSNNSSLLALLGLAGLAGYGGINSANASKNAGALQSNISNIAAPLSTAGNAALSQTLAGGLTPQNMQVLRATQAQLSQGEATGAVSAQQSAEALSTTFANLLQTQLNQALQLLNSADGYLQQAYLSGYQANTTNATNTTNFYTSLAQLAASMGGLGGPSSTAKGA